MPSIFIALVFATSLCFGVFAQSGSDQPATMDNSGKSFETNTGTAGTVDTDTPPKADASDVSAAKPDYGDNETKGQPAVVDKGADNADSDYTNTPSSGAKSTASSDDSNAQ